MAIAPVRFIIETKDELQKVLWPKRAEVIKLTSQVIIISVFFAAFAGGLDYLFTSLNQLIIK